MDIKFPNIKVKLIGTDGNAFVIMGKVVDAMRKGKIDPQTIKDFREECMSGDYNNLLRTCMKYVNVK